MAALTVQESTELSTNGAVLTEAAAAGGGDTFVNDGRTVFVVNNGSGGAITVTFAAVAACNHGVTHNLAVSVGAGIRKGIGPFPVERFGTTVGVSYSGVTSLTVAPRRLR